MLASAQATSHQELFARLLPFIRGTTYAEYLLWPLLQRPADDVGHRDGCPSHWRQVFVSGRLSDAGRRDAIASANARICIQFFLQSVAILTLITRLIR